MAINSHHSHGRHGQCPPGLLRHAMAIVGICNSSPGHLQTLRLPTSHQLQAWLHGTGCWVVVVVVAAWVEASWMIISGDFHHLQQESMIGTYLVKMRALVRITSVARTKLWCFTSFAVRTSQRLVVDSLDP